MSLLENDVFAEQLNERVQEWLESFHEDGLEIKEDHKGQYVIVLDDCDEHCSATKKVYLPKELTIEYYG